jgi:hypothetical protein
MADRESPRAEPTALPQAALFVPNASVRALSGISPGAFAALALVALLAARGIAPALPGTATGIAELITAMRRFAACASQLVAAGGIVLCLRLMGTVFTLPSLGVAFRFATLPAGLGVIALVFAAIARPLEPDLGKLLAVAAIVATACAGPFLLAQRWARLPGAILLGSALSGVLALLACEAGRRAGTLDRAQSIFALSATLGSMALELAACILALIWATRTRRRLLTTSAVTLTLAGVLLGFAHVGESHDANAAFVLLHRSLEALSQQPPSALPAELGQAAALLQLLLAGALLVLPGQRADARAALSLCVLGGLAEGAPVGALLSVSGALLLAAASCDPHAPPERLVANIAD